MTNILHRDPAHLDYPYGHDGHPTTDDEILAAVLNALHHNSGVPSSHIRADVKDGRVTLTGIVCQDYEMTLAEQGQQPHIQDVTYQRFVRPLLSKSGCDSGVCHGNERGGGGLRFRQSSSHNRQDYDAILLRLDRKNPEKSELVEKILNLVPHNGGRNIDPKSCDYARLIAWMLSGRIIRPLRR